MTPRGFAVPLMFVLLGATTQPLDADTKPRQPESSPTSGCERWRPVSQSSSESLLVSSTITLTGPYFRR